MSFGDLGLSFPDLFPARPGGELWGRCEVTINLIGGPYNISGLSVSQQERILEVYEPLIYSSGDDSRIGLQVFRASHSDFLPLPEGQHDYELDLDPTPNFLRLACHEFMARLEGEERLGGAIWTPHSDGEAFDRVFANILRILVAYAVLETGGVLIHSAGLLAGEEAMLFVGHSGAGKSTISRLGKEAGYLVLSDDLNALSLDGDVLELEKMPFTGEFRSEGPYGRFPLRSVFRLRKGEGTEIRPVPSGEAMAFLTSCCPFVNLDPYRSERLLANLDGLVSCFTVEDLTFSLAGDFWDLLARGRAA